jgi:RNA-binding protein
MPLTPKERQYLKGLAHKLKPVVLIGGNGLTAAVNKEIDRALNDHELIKVRIQSQEREQRRQILADISAAVHAELVQTIGAIGVFYRKRKE